MHSATPWRVGGEYDNQRDEIESFYGGCIAVVWVRQGPPGAMARQQFKDIAEGRDNLERIVACVNGCAGIANPAAVGELLAALVDLRDAFTDLANASDLCGHDFAVMYKVDAAIALAKGEQPATATTATP